MVKLNVDPVRWHVFSGCAGCDVGADGSCRSVWVRIAAMSSSVADGITLWRNEKRAGPRIIIASTFPIRVVLVVCQALVAEKVPALSAFPPDSA
jgi:hypothetical protein